MKNLKRRRRRGQTILEYVLIICIVVVASVGILSIFSDTIRKKIAGVVKTIDPSNSEVDAESGKSSKEIMEELDEEGLPE